MAVCRDLPWLLTCYLDALRRGPGELPDAPQCRAAAAGCHWAQALLCAVGDDGGDGFYARRGVARDAVLGGHMLLAVAGNGPGTHQDSGVEGEKEGWREFEQHVRAAVLETAVAPGALEAVLALQTACQCRGGLASLLDGACAKTPGVCENKNTRCV